MTKPKPERTMSVITNAMSVDVEDYYQVGAFEGHLSKDDWSRFPFRAERNTEAVLALFDRAGVKATFFTLGWVAERAPGLMRRIVENGHELACHGYAHDRVIALGADAFRADIRRTRAILEDAGGVKVHGYRAPSFSMGSATPWAHTILAEEGFTYSSSVYPVSHDHYGEKDGSRIPYRPFGAGTDFLEIPPTTAQLFGRTVPAAGGGFFRFLPYGISRHLINRVNGGERQPANFYFHPWEIDPDQPRIEGATAKARFRHYVNLGRMEAKLARLLSDFRWAPMRTAYGLEAR